MSLKIIEAGPLITVQDLGRLGFQRFGVPTSGAMDGLAFRVANALVCNSAEAACLEIGLGNLIMRVDDPCVIAVTGRGMDLVINDQGLPSWSAIYVRSGWEVEVVRREWGWAYLALAGGIDVPLVLGSRSTYLRGSFGGVEGRVLRSGDVLCVGQSRHGAEIAGRAMMPPAYAYEITVDAIPGPQMDQFTEEGVNTFLSTEYAITLESDRMGYRLSGETIRHSSGADIVSDGIVLGTVQIPSSGQPILMMSDHATTGGYTKIATVSSLDTWRIAQCPPGKGKIQFRMTKVEAAQRKYRQVFGDLRAGIADPRNERWLAW